MRTANIPSILGACVALGLCPALVGCGPSGPVTYEVSGKITLDGKPVSSGEIVFRTADGSAASWAGRIVDGRYSFRATAGQKRVEITATREVRSKVESASGEGDLQYEHYIPAKYNVESELSAQVTSDGANVFDFPLEP